MAKRKKRTSRDEELSGRKEVREKLLKQYDDIRKGFSDQRERSDDILDYWDLYNCVLGARQFYNGRSEIFIPIVRDAVEARKTRFVNQMFPNSQRYIEVICSEPDHPLALVALLEHYVRATRLRTQVMPALCVNGDIEGQMTLYVDWSTVERHVVSRQTEAVKVHGMEFPDLGEVETISEEVVTAECPAVEVIADPDFLVLPVTVDRLEDALERSGSVTVIRRWSKAKIQQMIDDGDFDEEAGDSLIESMHKAETDQSESTKKKLADDAGIKTEGGKSFALVYETWLKLKIDDDRRICRGFLGGEDLVLGCKLNPNWSDRLNILSAPVKKIPGVFKGQSMLKAGVMDMQIAANDACNQGQDGLAFALAPLMAVDPQKVSRWQELILDVGAVWPVDPSGMKQFTFPMLTKDAYEIVMAAERRIFQSLGVNVAMIPQQSGSKTKKLSQAEIANEQQVDILTTADSVTNIEGEILTPLVQMFAELDHQHREHDVTVQSFGELGLKAELEQIPPIQMGKRWELRWFGVEAARTAAQVQQMIAAANVIRGIPAEMYPGYRMNMAPLLMRLSESAFGARLGREIFISLRDELAVDVEQENELIGQGFDLLVHMQDDDPKHMQAHAQLPPSPNRDAHIMRHQMQMQAKQAKQAMQGGAQGVPGGAGPGVAGTPKPGAQPAQPRQNKGPPGQIRPDSMPRAGAVGMPRKM